MKTGMTRLPGWAAIVSHTTILLLAGLVTAQSGQQVEWREAGGETGEPRRQDKSLRGDSDGTIRKFMRIESVEPSPEKQTSKEVAWLGVSTEEVSDALASQLGLQSGEGLVVVYVAPDSPAAKAGIEKHDVLVEMGDQLLVHPAQMRKLVQARKERDTVSMRLFRHGQKRTISATLGKTTERAGLWLEGPRINEKQRVALQEAMGADLEEPMRNLHEALARGADDRRKIEIELQRSVEQARKSLQDALRHNARGVSVLGQQAEELEALARGGVDLRKNATVVVKKDTNSVKTMVKTDTSGTYVIVANPRKRLTVHDQYGKLLFDGEIETDEQQEKVPQDLWPKLKSMLEQMGPEEREESEPQAQSAGDKKT